MSLGSHTLGGPRNGEGEASICVTCPTARQVPTPARSQTFLLHTDFLPVMSKKEEIDVNSRSITLDTCPKSKPIVMESPPSEPEIRVEVVDLHRTSMSQHVPACPRCNNPSSDFLGFIIVDYRRRPTVANVS